MGKIGMGDCFAFLMRGLTAFPVKTTLMIMKTTPDGDAKSYSKRVYYEPSSDD